MLSDGDDTSSLVEYDEVLDLAKRSETAIYAIGLRPQSIGRREFKEAEFVLRQLSQETGGRVFFPTSVTELPKIYEQISDELASQYTLAYASKNPLRNGAWRRIVVRVKRPGADRADQAGLLRARRHTADPMHLVPLVFYAAAAARLRDAFRAARAARRPHRDGAARRRRARAHVPDRHADGRRPGTRRSSARRAAISAFVWLLGARVSLRRADDRRAGDGRVRRGRCWRRST